MPGGQRPVPARGNLVRNLDHRFVRAGYRTGEEEPGFEPTMVDVAEAGTYTVTFVNDGGIPHDVTFADGTTIAAAGHATATGEVTVPADGITFICTVPGHADAGMTGEVMVGMATASGAPARMQQISRIERFHAPTWESHFEVVDAFMETLA